MSKQKTIVTGAFGASRAWVMREFIRTQKKVLVVCPTKAEAEAISSDLSFFLGDTLINQLPSWDTLPFEMVSPQKQISAQRISTLLSSSDKDSSITIASVEALQLKVLPIDIFKGLTIYIEQQDKLSRESLILKLDQAGFDRVSLVQELGNCAVHGNVIDIFPSTTLLPIRLEFRGDEIFEIRYFDPDSQRSLENINKVTILPVRELYGDTDSNSLERSLEHIKQQGKLLECPPREIARYLNTIRNGIRFPGEEQFQYIIRDTLSVFEIFSDDTAVVLVDEPSIKHQSEAFYDELTERHREKISKHHLVPNIDRIYLNPEYMLSELNKNASLLVNQFRINTSKPKNTAYRSVHPIAHTELKTNLQVSVGSGQGLLPLRKFVDKWRNDGNYVAFVVGSESRGKRLTELLLSSGIDAPLYSGEAHEWIDSKSKAPVVILEGSLTAGFEINEDHFVFVSESEIFKTKSLRKGKVKTTSLKRLLGALSQLKENEYVVHADYGIGIYRGLKHIELEGVGSDFLHIEYSDSRLYLPVQNIGKVQRFVAAEGQRPIIDKLGSTRWVRTKQKVRQSIISLAGDLIKLYATRTIAKGWRYEPFGAEDERFAEGFAYDETPDQRKAIEESLVDLSKDKPMDRLICGDVGFGKTEVAIRAAFKVTQHARQVAVLVPTTILVEQHTQSFRERFLGYPVTIGSISRFYSAKENKETLRKLGTGELDIVIGTHSLLGRGVKFKDLGLIIIDEEHRFGVQQKEKLKQLKSKVDVLTLTATPIPRTLHMALLGIRDISVIQTPPVDRRVIRTYLAFREDTIIRDAITREIKRGGQVFFLFNRVEGIEIITSEIQNLVPEAKVRFAHGQMPEEQLELIMASFIRHEFDVLVSTTIIESGLDIPNANTILVDQADMFGLAQLYQLRGRVGRSTKQAYAYFLISQSKKLGAEAQLRLQVLQSLDDLGVGFNLALRDMEIRGVGNLLGREQSGNVLAVGFELYNQIVKEAVQHLRGEEIDITETIDPEIKLNANAFIPDFYIPDVAERLVLYQRLTDIIYSEDADALREEMEDRFGPLPPEAQEFIELMRFRGLLRQFGIAKAELIGEKLNFGFSPEAPIDIQKILDITKQNPRKYKFSKGLSFTMILDTNEVKSVEELYPPTSSILHFISQSSNKNLKKAEKDSLNM